MALTKVSNDLLATPTDTTGLETDIALLGFKVAANGSLAAYDLKDQTIDAFEDASGIDASASTNESRNAANYYIGGTTGSGATTVFTSTGASTWTAPTPSPPTVEVLVVGGGGSGGGKYYAGGGGAGGIVHATDYAVVAGTVYDITVGAGGSDSSSSAQGNDGSDSVWNVNAEGSGITLTATGGGGGGSSDASNGDGRDGGSGGGGAMMASSRQGGSTTQNTYSGTANVTGYGYDGGDGYDTSNNYPAGGGGGAGAVGASSSSSGAGGIGRQFTNFGAYGTDSSNSKGSGDGSGSGKGYFGGGGGGAGYNNPPQPGGAGGGGTSARGDTNTQPTAGLANTGGGGGGASHNTTDNGKAGGSGFVGIYYADFVNPQDLTLVSSSTTASSAPTTGDIVMTYTNGAGTATVNTDLKAWISRDNGTTYTQATLSSEGTTGGHTILTAHNVDISSQPSGTSMRYKITTHNQSASKETRIQAVSLGWS